MTPLNSTRNYDSTLLAFTPEAFGLVVRAAEGYLRRARNLCVGSLLEAVRDRVRTVDLKQVNCVLLQAHWRDREVAP